MSQPNIPVESVSISFGLTQSPGLVIHSFGGMTFDHCQNAASWYIFFGIVGLLNQVAVVGDLICSNLIIASTGMFITDAVTTLESDMINCTNHHVSGTRMMPSASRGRSFLYQ